MVDMSVGTLNPAKLGELAAQLDKVEVVSQDEGASEGLASEALSGAAAERRRWKETDARAEAERQRDNRALWLEHFTHLAQVFRARAAEYERQAEELGQG